MGESIALAPVKTVVLDTFSNDPENDGAQGAILYINPMVVGELIRARQAFNAAKAIEPGIETIRVWWSGIDFCEWSEQMVDTTQEPEVTGLDSGAWRVYSGHLKALAPLLQVDARHPHLVIWDGMFQWESYYEREGLTIYTARIDDAFLTRLQREWEV